MLSTIAGSGLEGVFLISTIIMLVRGIWHVSDRKSPFKSFMKSSWRIGLIVFLVATIVGIILSDVGFQQKTGGERPDMWVLLSHIKNFSSGAKAEFKDSSKGAMRLIYGCLATGGLTFLVCLLHEKRLASAASRKQVQEMSSSQMCKVVLLGFTIMSILYMAGAWMPVFHTYASVCGSFFLSPPGSKAMAAALHIDPSMIQRVPKSLKAPNVILVIHESLSGELMMTQDTSVQATPFFHRMLKSDEEYFVFEHARTVSGDTTDAITAIQSGCNPLDHKKSREFALNTTLATEFKKQGFDTVSFSSRGLNLEGTKWFMTQHQLSTNFDQIYDPKVTQDPLVNPPGQDDREMVKYFKKWLEQRKEGDGPFFAQFYYFNAHYPFFNNHNKSSESRLDGMLETVDQSIETIFQFLNETANLDNTILIGSADHGERSKPSTYGRLREWSRDILHAPIYMHMPRSLFKTTRQYETLRHNTHQLISTLDIFPTIMHLLKGKSQENYPVMDEHCVRGFDLLETKIASDRIAWSFPGVSKDISRERRGNMAIHTGTSSSLLNRFGWPKDNNLTVVEYAPIIGSKNPKSLKEKKPLDMDEWKSVLQNLEGTSDDMILTKKGAYITELLKSLGLHST